LVTGIDAAKGAVRSVATHARRRSTGVVVDAAAHRRARSLGSARASTFPVQTFRLEPW